ncbi:MAG TPA: cytochrome c oxidase subunit II [Cytophagaceae bacterium]
MVELVLGIAIVLILAILLIIFRIQTLMSIMKGSYNKRVGSSNSLQALLLLISFIVGAVAFAWSYLEAREDFLPKAVSVHGLKTDTLFWTTMIILVVAFTVTNIFLFYFTYKYQYREGKRGYFYPENHKLEVVWTIIPAIVMAILVYYGWKEWTAITKEEPKESEVIEVMGKQFAWQVRYPGKDNKLGASHFKLIDGTNEFGLNFNDSASFDDFMPREIRIPKGKPVLFKIRARDVIHSVYAPHFRLKMDAVPGMPTKFWFIPTKTTQEMRDELGNPKFNYELACAEICGRGHFAMRYVIVVEEPEDYEKWKKEQTSFAAANADYVKERAPKELHSLIGGSTQEVEKAEATISATIPTDTTSISPVDSVSGN